LTLKPDSASGYRFAAVATLASAVAGITLLSGILEPRWVGFGLRPLIQIEAIPDAHWFNNWLAGAQTARVQQADALQEWLGVVGILLFIIVALAGISALIALFAHATARRYQIALAAAVGASRAQLTVEQLRSAVLNAGIALLVGVPIGLAGAWLVSSSWPHTRSGMSATGWLLLSLLFSCSIAGLVARAAAARMSRRGWLGDVLAPEARTNPGYGAEDLRALLLHVQIALTFALLTSALLVWQQARTPSITLTARAADSVVTRLAIDEHATAAQRRQIHRQLRGYASATPGALIGVGHSDQVLSNCGRCTLANMYAPLFPLRTQQHAVGDGFFARAGFGIMQGREFETSDAAARRVVVNDTFATLAFQGQPPIGKTIQVGGLQGTWYTVIGVVEDIPISGLLSFTPDEHSVIRSNRPGHEPAIYFMTQEQAPTEFDVISDGPLSIQLAGVSMLESRPLANVLTRARAPAGWFANMLAALALAAAVIAMVTLGALTLLNVRQRQMEMAARRAVGARRRDILALVFRNTALTAARGIFAGVLLSVAVARAIQMLLPTMQLFDLEIAVAAAAALGVVSLVAAALPARTATRVSPAQLHT
jgi:putative ABC transport system permease protein